ncbi:hypothetical protein [Streptomyces atroolivaceus]|uniref:hypothetical protein n=1 Tax=Streptomyces atroolivaceus TaxID=66869 RepID=UPI002023CAC6|nr:hypothetical protein [Streptomyces atroolivaceus]
MNGRESGVGAGGQDALGDEGADLLDDGDLAGALALGALVGQSAGCGCGLAAYGPDPLVGVDVLDAAAGDFADPGGGARGEDDDVSPSAVLVVGGGHERVGQLKEGVPVGQGQRAEITKFVLGLLVESLPAGHAGGVDANDAVPDGLFHDADQDGDGVLDR